MKISLRNKLSLSYMSVIVIAVVLISVLSNFFLEKQFTKYVTQNQEQKSKLVVESISKQYLNADKWGTAVIENIGVDALEQGMIVSIKDTKGKKIWDARVYNNGMCNEMLAHMSKNMSGRYSFTKGGYQENHYPIYKNAILIGTVYIGYYGPVYFTDNDVVFMNTFNKIIMGVGVVALLIALLISMLMARGISNPISKVINTALMIAKGNYKHISNIKSDIKEITLLADTINELSETLEEQEILRKRLTADVAHELRTPIATLQSHMEAMIDGIWEPDVHRLTSCQEEIMRIGRMIGDLEKIAKYESENLTLNKEEFDISGLIKNAILNFSNEYSKKKIEIEFDGTEEVIYADKDKISQVIVNLISNALKYTGEGGNVMIKVTVAEEEDMLKISIKDNGIGVSAEDLPYIFERFYRADKSRSRLTGGSGIGLTITKSIVDAHRGKIDITSKISEGTEICVYLPKV